MSNPVTRSTGASSEWKHCSCTRAATSLATDTSGDILLAVVSLCRSLCIGTATLVHVVDDHLTDAQAAQLTDDDLLPVAMSIIRSYATTAARRSDNTTSDDPRR